MTELGLPLDCPNPKAAHLVLSAGTAIDRRTCHQSVHAKHHTTKDTTDPLHPARSAETTSLWRLITTA
ncbi:hypothetical protein [Streptomyces camelliae]|uniref:Uncharacterized protein n=1 Tax=Streptomyces camelliae TaxID=3004093 RepID=A0ABY7P3U4_9ACTN|nr:hypothetical protein [Streptomyces sp. HUAS 2-6]WBO64225.1 hypothetical protein O1G22_16005 [Streptomyces sp. HUAS 2-6]